MNPDNKMFNYGNSRENSGTVTVVASLASVTMFNSMGTPSLTPNQFSSPWS